MRIKYSGIFILLILILSSCQMGASANATPSPEKTQIAWPTATYRVWATIAPDNVASPTPTVTARPLRTQPSGRIAYQSDQAGSLDIYVMNADGSQVSRLTNNSGVDVFPAWSPDGKRIAFTSDMDGNPEIYTMNADGTQVVRLTNDPSDDIFPTWSPDGEQIAFVSNRDGGDKIYVMSTDGSGLKKLTNDIGDDDSPSWSPDGEWIVFASTRDFNSEIYKMDKNGKNLIRLTDDPSADYTPAWSPDGKRIAFVSRRDGFTNLYIMGSDGKNVVQLTQYKSVIEVPSWSPDGKMIAFASDFEASRDIFIISADGAGMNRLTENPGEEFYPAWSPELPFLAASLPEPTAAPDSVCVNSTDPTYGFSIDNPIRIGYDPRQAGSVETGCVPWLLGPQGQSLNVQLLDEIQTNEGEFCKVSVSFEGQDEPDIMYFDIHSYEQPKAPVGYSCGSPVEYLKALSAARYQ